ncbi:hypothetical protein IAU59_007550 [Kwoniella sp. CBS 9459]
MSLPQNQPGPQAGLQRGLVGVYLRAPRNDPTNHPRLYETDQHGFVGEDLFRLIHLVLAPENDLLAQAMKVEGETVALCAADHRPKIQSGLACYRSLPTGRVPVFLLGYKRPEVADRAIELIEQALKAEGPEGYIMATLLGGGTPSARFERGGFGIGEADSNRMIAKSLLIQNASANIRRFPGQFRPRPDSEGPSPDLRPHFEWDRPQPPRPSMFSTLAALSIQCWTPDYTDSWKAQQDRATLYLSDVSHGAAASSDPTIIIPTTTPPVATSSTGPATVGPTEISRHQQQPPYHATSIIDLESAHLTTPTLSDPDSLASQPARSATGLHPTVVPCSQQLTYIDLKSAAFSPMITNSDQWFDATNAHDLDYACCQERAGDKGGHTTTGTPNAITNRNVSSHGRPITPQVSSNAAHLPDSPDKAPEDRIRTPIDFPLKVALKLCVPDLFPEDRQYSPQEARDRIVHEARLYTTRLTRLQGHAVPKLFGLFCGNALVLNHEESKEPQRRIPVYMFVLERLGKPVAHSWDDVDLKQRTEIFRIEKALQSLEIRHGDLGRPHHFLYAQVSEDVYDNPFELESAQARSKGRQTGLRLIDFEAAKLTN